jgi:hypothetical protein
MPPERSAPGRTHLRGQEEPAVLSGEKGAVSSKATRYVIYKIEIVIPGRTDIGILSIGDRSC